MHTFQIGLGRQCWKSDILLWAFTSVRENGEGVLGLGKKKEVLY